MRFCLLLLLLASCAKRTVSFHSKTYEASKNILNMPIQEISVDADEIKKDCPDFYENKTIKEIFKEALEERIGKNINSPKKDKQRLFIDIMLRSSSVDTGWRVGNRRYDGKAIIDYIINIKIIGRLNGNDGKILFNTRCICHTKFAVPSYRADFDGIIDDCVNTIGYDADVNDMDIDDDIVNYFDEKKNVFLKKK